MAVKPSQLAPADGRDIAAILDPCPLTIIGAQTPDGRTGFATVIWATPVSHNPAMVAFALRAKSHTMGLIREAGVFSLSTLPADEESVQLVEYCGNNTGHRIDKTERVAFEVVSAHDGEGAEYVAPVPLHALSWEIGRVESIQEAGDHLLVIGRVLCAASAASRDGKGRLAPTETLLCIQHGAYAPAGEALPCE